MGFVMRLLDRVNAAIEHRTWAENRRRFERDVRQLRRVIGVPELEHTSRSGKRYVSAEIEFMKIWRNQPTYRLAGATGRTRGGVKRFMERKRWQRKIQRW